MSSAARIWAVVAMAGLAGCAGDPVRLGPDSDPRAARTLLKEVAAAGPVRLELNQAPRAADGTLTAERAAEQAARGIKGLDARFAQPPAAKGPARLVLLFDPPQDVRPQRVCGADLLPSAVPGAWPHRLQAVFCDGGAFVADATSATEGRALADLDRLVWRTTGRLFPDDYPDTYGFNLFGHRVTLGGSIGL
jgi:hypothetical protein